MALTTLTTDWLAIVLSYGLLFMAARALWLALRGWHLLAKKDAPLIDFAAVSLPWGIVSVAAIGPIVMPEPWSLALPVVAGSMIVIGLLFAAWSGLALRWRALGTDPEGLGRLGVDTVGLVRQLVLWALVCTIVAVPLGAEILARDPVGHWGIAGIAIILLSGRLMPGLIVMAATSTLGLLLREQTLLLAPLAAASVGMACLLLLARRWREQDQVLHVD